MTDLVVRPLQAGEEHLFDTYPDPVSVGFAAFGRKYTDLLERGEYRPGWTWVATRGDRVVARAAWWAGPDDEQPITLDWLDCTDPADGAAILRAATLRAEYCLAVPPGWQADPQQRRERAIRIEAAHQAGMKPLVERLRYRWTPECGVPATTGRLVFRPEPDDDVVLDVLRRVQRGSLDAHKIADIARLGEEAAARAELEELRWFPGPRAWWLLAYTPAGDLVGITVPSRNYAAPVVCFIGVVPEHRGNGYAHDLVAECTRFLVVAANVTEIVAETDATNTPMAATFTKAGYPVTQERVYLSY